MMTQPEILRSYHFLIRNLFPFDIFLETALGYLGPLPLLLAVPSQNANALVDAIKQTPD